MSTSTRLAISLGIVPLVLSLGACVATAPAANQGTMGSVNAPPAQNITETGRVVRIDSVAMGQGGSTNVGAAAVGAVVGGVLGNQVGGGRGRTLATVAGVAGGAVAGNAIGSSGNQAREVSGVFRITIQLDQGGQRVIDVPDLGDLRQGDRVQVINGQQISRMQ